MTHSVWLLHNVSNHISTGPAPITACVSLMYIYIISLYINRHPNVLYIKKLRKIKKGKNPEKLKKRKKLKKIKKKIFISLSIYMYIIIIPCMAPTQSFAVHNLTVTSWMYRYSPSCSSKEGPAQPIFLLRGTSRQTNWSLPKMDPSE